MRIHEGTQLGPVAARAEEAGEGASEAYVMMHAPDPGYAGHLGDEVSVVDRSPKGVYVLFDSGIREFFPPARFAALFRRR